MAKGNRQRRLVSGNVVIENTGKNLTLTADSTVDNDGLVYGGDSPSGGDVVPKLRLIRPPLKIP